MEPRDVALGAPRWNCPNVQEKMKKKSGIFNMGNRVDQSKESFPKSVLAVVFGCRGASG